MTPQKVLFVLTSTATMGVGGKPTGLWLEEFTIPYFAIHDAGYSIDIVSTAGGAVPIDPRSVGGESARQLAENGRYLNDPQLVAALAETPLVEEVRFGDYAAVFLPGGHGTMWDLPKSQTLADGVVELFTAGKPVAAVCHGPAGLVGATLPDGRPLVAGRYVSAFTTEEEVAVGLRNAVPFLLDARLAELGAHLVKGEPFKPTAVENGNLITGQNPQSARAAAALLVAELKQRSAVAAEEEGRAAG